MRLDINANVIVVHIHLTSQFQLKLLKKKKTSVKHGDIKIVNISDLNLVKFFIK